jgi:hypothetical protein
MALKTPDASGSLPAWRWNGAETLEFVYALNRRCLDVLAAQVAQQGRRVLECEGFEIVSAWRELWLALDEGARGRAAKCPFLLVGLRFDSLPWWQAAERSAPDDLARSLADASFPRELARELSAEILTLAWHTARQDARVASLVLGLAPGVARVIASFGPRDIQRIAARQAHQLRPRWRSNQQFWGELLRTAISGKEKSQAEFHLHALQLLGKDLVGANETT